MRYTPPSVAQQLGMFDPEFYGIVAAGTAAAAVDQSTALTTMLTAVYAAGGGVIEFESGYYRFDSQLSIPNDAATSPGQPTFIFRGKGNFEAGRAAQTPTGGTFLDFRFAGNKILTRGLGVLRFESLTLWDTSTTLWTTGTVSSWGAGSAATATTPITKRLTATASIFTAAMVGRTIYFDNSNADAAAPLILKGFKIAAYVSGTQVDVYYDASAMTGTFRIGHAFIDTTNTIIRCHNVSFIGKDPTTGSAYANRTFCADDAVIGGGFNATEPTTVADNMGFQGYGTVIRECWFETIHHGFIGRNFANGVILRDNHVGLRCGGHSFFELYGFVGSGAVQACSGTVFSGNLVELVGYKYGVYAQYTSQCQFLNNNWYDEGASVSARYYFDTKSYLNLVSDGFYNDAKTHVSDNADSATLTSTIITSHQTQMSTLPQNMTIGGTLAVTGIVTPTGGITMAGTGAIDATGSTNTAPLQLKNATYIAQKDAAGTLRSLFGLDGSNNFVIGPYVSPASPGSTIIKGPAATSDITLDGTYLYPRNGMDIYIWTTGAGNRIGTAATALLGFYGATPVVQRSGAAQAAITGTTNNVTSGGSSDVIADFTSLTVYATDAAAIRNDIYQLARKMILHETLLNELRAWAVAQGFIKGSA